MPPGAAPKIQIPRWMQLVGLPLLLVLAWVVAGRVFHVVFLFLVASLIALLLDPVVGSSRAAEAILADYEAAHADLWPALA